MQKQKMTAEERAWADAFWAQKERENRERKEQAFRQVVAQTIAYHQQKALRVS